MMRLTQAEEQRYGELCAIALDLARRDNADELEKMIKAGLSVNLKSAKGDTLLMLASYNNALKTVNMLLSNGARVDERNDRGQTPLAGAAFKGHLEVVKALVNAGADVEATSGLGMTPYAFAVMFGRSETAKFLLSKRKKQGLLQKLAVKFLGILAKKSARAV
ncbi:MAG: ankyrin repeat domain-containing protein [Campylobacter sp.]|uniref:ankyrin repeat domain-containing protein n=1 Tax=uncultured Campylobacter sp. TaxID=218934 RepID=UPI00261A80CD|nr:ankyrin repeat domain-containing protein [uncultured Campylobacter sp.]